LRPFKDLYPNANIISAESTSRKLPKCKGVRPNNPFLIKIKELPQIKESNKRKTHFLTVLDMAIS
jgi:hypothetical protein